MRKISLCVLAVGLAAVSQAHVTPNVSLVRRGEFVKASLPGATKFFEKTLGPEGLAAVQRETGWTPSAEEAKIYIGRDDGGRLVGSVVFLWTPSQHGPVGLGVGFAPDGTIRRATVTDVGSEPLVWIRPLLADGVLAGAEGLSLSASPDPSRIGGAASGNMVHYYAKVIADGIARAQSMERARATSR